jgi:uroporphyrinogen III methyltransferase/synthase
LASLDQYDWVVFTSQNGVQFARQRLLEMGKDARAFGGARIAVIGEATAAAVRQELCLNVELCPKKFVAEALADELAQRGEIVGKRFLLLRADIARPLLRQRLQALRAAEVRDVAIYQTQGAKALSSELLEALDEGAVDWITFTSSSTAKNFVTLLGPSRLETLRGVKLASIGPVTTATLRDLGLEPTVQAQTYVLEGLIAAMMEKNG